MLIRSNCDENIGTILREHYDRPYFLPPTAESEKTDWIFMGSTGYGAPMHVSLYMNEIKLYKYRVRVTYVWLCTYLIVSGMCDTYNAFAISLTRWTT